MKLHMIFGLCNVLTVLDHPFERLHCEDFNGGPCFKAGGGGGGGGGRDTRRDIYIWKIES
jgi:hypothetical protein